VFKGTHEAGKYTFSLKGEKEQKNHSQCHANPASSFKHRRRTTRVNPKYTPGEFLKTAAMWEGVPFQRPSPYAFYPPV
jgi:hypothetical protein